MYRPPAQQGDKGARAYLYARGKRVNGRCHGLRGQGQGRQQELSARQY
jgi:hypothetical protein